MACPTVSESDRILILHVVMEDWRRIKTNNVMMVIRYQETAVPEIVQFKEVGTAI